MMSTDYLQSHLLVRLLGHQGPPCALIYHYQVVYLLPQGAVICLTCLSVGLPLAPKRSLRSYDACAQLVVAQGGTPRLPSICRQRRSAS